MIGFDLDGVLVSDVAWTPEIIQFRNTGMNALFVPQGDYVIVTSRPNAEKETREWIDRELAGNPPKQVFAKNSDWQRSIEYKVGVLERFPEITIFVESDLETVRALRVKFPNRRIVHFKSEISALFGGYYTGSKGFQRPNVPMY